VRNGGDITITRADDNSERITRNDAGVVITSTPGRFTVGNEFTSTLWQNGKLRIEQSLGGQNKNVITQYPNLSGTEVKFAGKGAAVEVTGDGKVRVLLDPPKPVVVEDPVREPSTGRGARPYAKPFSRPFPSPVPRAF
jgi:hypothetical protein